MPRPRRLGSGRPQERRLDIPFKQTLPLLGTPTSRVGWTGGAPLDEGGVVGRQEDDVVEEWEEARHVLDASADDPRVGVPCVKEGIKATRESSVIRADKQARPNPTTHNCRNSSCEFL